MYISQRVGYQLKAVKMFRLQFFVLFCHNFLLILGPEITEYNIQLYSTTACTSQNILVLYDIHVVFTFVQQKQIYSRENQI